MNEKSYWKNLRICLLNNISNIHIQRIENSIGIGVPDSNVSLPNGKEFWLEGKVFLLKKKIPDIAYIFNLLSEGQKIWLNTRCRNGSNIFIWAVNNYDKRWYLVHLNTNKMYVFTNVREVVNEIKTIFNIS